MHQFASLRVPGENPHSKNRTFCPGRHAVLQYFHQSYYQQQTLLALRHASGLATNGPYTSGAGDEGPQSNVLILAGVTGGLQLSVRCTMSPKGAKHAAPRSPGLLTCTGNFLDLKRVTKSNISTLSDLLCYTEAFSAHCSQLNICLCFWFI